MVGSAAQATFVNRTPSMIAHDGTGTALPPYTAATMPEETNTHQTSHHDKLPAATFTSPKTHHNTVQMRVH
jgi:hypothetical protein